MIEPSIEDYLKVVITQNQRIYDVLLALLFCENESAYQNLIDTHANFDNVGPAPFITEE